MTPPWEIKANRVICLGDIHQRLSWARAVLEHEVGNYDKVVWMGDYFDSWENPPQVSGARETAIFVKSLLEDNGGIHHVLLGNHDVPYAESWPYNNRHTSKHNLINYCSGFTKSKSKEINGVLSWDNWQKARLFYLVNGWLVSHAGVHPAIWMPYITAEKNLERLEGLCQGAILHFGSSQLLACGVSRGGGAPIGGITWLDFNREFVDGLPFPQVVGHTEGKKVRMVGRSYCIDTGTSYAIIHGDGRLETKTLKYHSVIAEEALGWMEEETPVVDMTIVAMHRNSTINSLPPHEYEALKAIIDALA